jgi:hypothetical protein
MLLMDARIVGVVLGFFHALIVRFVTGITRPGSRVTPSSR